MDKSTEVLPPIIAIDDSPDDLFFLERLLTKCGTKFPLIKFTDAAEAVAYLSAASEAAEPGRIPCFIFTDIKMPTMTGFEFLAWIRGQQKLNRLPVIVLSTSDEPTDLAKANALGVTRYYVKFPEPKEIAQIVAEVAGTHPAG